MEIVYAGLIGSIIALSAAGHKGKKKIENFLKKGVDIFRDSCIIIMH